MSVMLAAALVVFSSGCALLPPQSFLDPTKVGMFPGEYREVGIRRWLTPLESPGGPADATEPTPEDLVPKFEAYRVSKSDVVAFSIEDFLTGGVVVQEAREVDDLGYVRLPQIGKFRVEGLTEEEIEEELRVRIREAGILPNPILQVFVTNKRDRFFSITGSVRQAGPYALVRSDLRLLDAIGLVGDIAPEAKKLYIIRRTEPDWQPAEETQDSQVPDDGLIIPPPDDDDFSSGISASVFSRIGAVSQESRPATRDEPSLDELDALIAPARPEGQSTRPSEKRAFQPLIFDPETGDLEDVEIPVRREADEQPGAPADDPLDAGDDEDFRWEDLPEYELTQRVIEIDVAALKAGDPRQNIIIRDGDAIVVPTDLGVFYVMGEVNRPGVFSFGGREISVKQAIASVGGFSTLAWPSRCEVTRREKGTDRQIVVPVNLDRIFAGLEDDFLLRDGDILNVGTDIIAPFLFVIRNSFRFTYGFGFVYDRNFADKDSFGGRTNPETLKRLDRQARGLPF